MKTIELKIDGMVCGHCALTVKAALESVAGVKSAEVRLTEATAVVLYDLPDIAGLIAAVELEGYRATGGLAA